MRKPGTAGQKGRTDDPAVAHTKESLHLSVMILDDRDDSSETYQLTR